MTLKHPEGPGYRPPHVDRRFQSLNDWYGLGFLSGVLGKNLRNIYPRDTWFRWYHRGYLDQFKAGHRDGWFVRQGLEKIG